MSKRKVLFLMTDSQRADMLGCYGNPDMHTPVSYTHLPGNMG